MMKFFVTLSVLFACIIGFAQAEELSSHVKDALLESYNGFENVSVSYKNAESESIENGHYVLVVKSNETVQKTAENIKATLHPQYSIVKQGEVTHIMFDDGKNEKALYQPAISLKKQGRGKLKITIYPPKKMTK